VVDDVVVSNTVQSRSQERFPAADANAHMQRLQHAVHSYKWSSMALSAPVGTSGKAADPAGAGLRFCVGVMHAGCATACAGCATLSI
jgi:hypothetical protein